MNLSDSFAIPESVMAREVGNELVILDVASGSYFGLDPVGTRIWQLLSAGMCLADAAEVLVGEYEVERSQLEHDLVILAEKLLAQGLVEPRASAS
jgi:hypothetical protein